MTSSSDTVTSPCIAVCVIDTDSGFCKGCFRTMEEIGRWMLVDNEGRRAIVEAGEARRRAAGKRKPKAKPGRDFVDRSGAGTNRTPDPN